MPYRKHRQGEIIRIEVLAKEEDLRMAVYVMVGRQMDIGSLVGVLLGERSGSPDSLGL
jgi:hypothetical protein